MTKFKYILINLLFSGLIFISYTGCATTNGGGSSSNVDRLLIENPDLTLKDYLKRLSGVQVSDRGGDVRVWLRGASSISGDNSPLFVVDGSQVGTTFDSVNNAVDIRDVDYIRVVRASEAMTTYGMRASNGAIVIHTKRR